MNWEAVKNIVKLVTSNLWIFIKPLANFLMSDSGAVLRQIATDVVAELMIAGNLSSEEKRKEAFKRIVEKAKQRGLKVSTSTINAAIELAVYYLKNR